MSSDAASRDASRAEAIRRDAEAEAANGEKSLAELAATAPDRHHSEAAPFIEAARKSAFGGGSGAGDDLETRLGKNKYYAQKRGGEGQSSFGGR